ncbi:Dynein heavy chain 2, axonemal [Amphibalanus amphitrite]|uniref:Dynein heavy chain 2, axonemal n=1 Tax=Amphibalanus amphitrite TaxID=1232801 RepID=A0A6A4WMG9_AMPAM|nr:Dynein heavy chain 2, axonemal [Amphibalanus amphitrite]
MNVRLEEIQKRLEMYLETKRQAFPRFYFISNDDLLEILGQSKNPEAVQPHLKKLFDNMAKVKMVKIQWTVDTTRSLLLVKDLGEKKPLKSFRKKMMNMLNKFSEAIRSNLTKLQRMKIVALVTIEVHARDVIEKLIKAGVNDVNSFEWLSQLRLYWDKDEEDCVIRQTNTQFFYGYEYLGNSGRLVITPLTDRCYMTLTSALHLHRGGSPKGPAGTGKTETVKDLGKAMAVFVIVLNCSEGLDYKSMGKMFSGLAQTGAWGCFDEFNRINIEVLSVVAQQILSILQALSTLATQFIFEGSEIKLVDSCGIFITMNPGYAGRTELPDNLKSMFRPIAMVVPDSAMIAEIVLFGEGFSNTRNLARKVFTLYTLASRQLSKQSHYDFGLRGLIGLLRYAGIKKRMFPEMGDEEVVITAMNDMNLPKLTSDDSPLFAGIVSDLFPGVETPPLDYGQLYDVIRHQLKENGLQAGATPYIVDKVIQLYETKNSRHSVMMVGQTGTSKTSIWRTLQRALTDMANKGQEGYVAVKEYALNPKALNLGELYGEFDLGSGDWKDGVLSAIMRVTCADETPDQKWILFDGPVDAVWIENMNSVMDDNKVLTLINSERIALPAQVSLLFEVQDLDEASPATVSRAGMVYTDYKAIGWQPYVDSWLQTVQCKQTADELRKLFDKFLEDMLEFKRKNCKELMPIVELNGVISLCRLLDCLCTKEFGVDPSDMDAFLTCSKLWFLFSLLWSVCASVDEEGRKKIDNYLRELEGSFPNKDTVYEYAVDYKHRSWSPWESKLQSNWKYNPNVPFYKILVPTVDTVRYEYILRTLISHEFPAMLVGPVGTGKSSLASSVLAQMDVNKYTVLPVNMSAQTTSNNVQAIIESRMEKRTKNVYVPQGGKRLVVFLDDLNMPAKDTYGSQPPLELLRQWMQYGFWYDRTKQSSLYMQDVLLVGAMGPPGGGRSFISQRLQSKFNLVNMTFPQESQIKRIFGTLITQKLANFSEDVKPLGELVTTASIEMYQSVIANMLPTPAKIHYVFNLRDISKVFQGLLRSNRDYCDTKAAFVRLWIHECDFLNTNEIYEDILDFATLKQYMENQLKEYNATPGVVSMELVLFRDAICHICRTVRVLKLPRGNMLVVGIGGSGRQSLTRLAAYICGLSVFVIEVNKHYHRPEFREDLKVLYRATGLENKPTVFIFSDAQIRNTLQPVAAREGIPETPENLYGLLLDRVRSNLHLCVCMSPVGDAFRNRIRMYPGLVNCSTIDWFGEWPQEALMEVAERYLEGIDLNLGADTELLKDELQAAVAHTFSVIHRSVSNYSARMLAEVRRHNYVTSTSYLQLVAGYKHLLGEKRKELGEAADKLRNGLFKIDETSVKVESMSVELEIAKGKVAEFQQQCEEYLVIIVQQTREADEQQRSVQLRSQKIAEEELQCKAMAEVALAELEEVLPVLEEAVRALDALSKRDLNEIKSYARPPPLVEKVMEAVMLLKCVEPTWAEAKRQLGDPNFITQLRDFDKDHISDKTLKKVGGYVVQADFDPDMVGKQSLAAKSLCLWVRAIESYGRVYRVVEPKKMRLMSAERILAEKQKNLADAKAKLQELSERLAKLQTEYNEKLAQKEELRIKAESLELKLDRAAKIVSGLAGEKVRWTQTVKDLDENFGYLVGDCLIAAAFVSYMGPFTSNYRDEIVSSIWLPEVRGKLVPCSPTFELCEFLAKPTVVRDWNIQGLPSNPFSVENGIIATRGQRWPLLIDPQGQGLRWIKNMEHKQGLKVIDLQQTNFLSVLERSVTFGHPVLLQNVQETLDASLNPILTKSVIKQGDALYTKIGDKEVEYNPLFRFYISTKLSNPHYPPEIATKTTIINFTVKEDGLEQQLLGIVVRKERPELEEQKDALVTNIAAGKLKLIELEDAVLRLLKTEGSLLEDEALVVTLQSCKTTSADVTEQLETAEETEIKIDAAREAYRPCARRASILFFVLTDLGKIDPMYQFSLDAYVDLFTHSIDKAQRSPKLENRIQNMNDYHTYAVYKYACRGLFERHKLLFSFHMCIKMLESQSAVNTDEYLFFLKGGVVLDREEQMDNPCPEWLSDSAWDNITELERLANFHGVIQSFEQGHRDWYAWYTSPEPERASLPGEWDTSCSELQRMIFVRSLRPDRVSVCVSTFVIHNLGQRFVEPPVLDFHSVLEDSAAKTPLIFILSPGVDPTTALLQLAEQNEMMDRFYSLSLGQGQAPIATRLLEMGKRDGGWVFLANCHLSLSWMPELDKMVEEIQDGGANPEFRLWLSSSPHPDFPISILQNGIKITTEPPKGIKANIKRLYQNMTEAQFTACPRQSNYKKLLFSLCFFHSVLLERRKFQQLGWNILYGFNDSDFEVSESLLSIYLREYEDPPWDALKYLIAGVMYGGHVTDDWDRRLLMTYINQMFNEDVLNVTYYKLSSLAHYYIPRDGHLSYYQDFSNSLPMVDHPEAFGQHPNADIASSIGDARVLFETLLSLQPAVAAAADGQSSDDKVIGLANDVLTKMPDLIDFESTQKILSNDPCPLNVVLLQEIQRYNVLLVIIRRSLEDLKKGIKGLVVMSSDLEEVFVCVLEGRVPPPWLKDLGAAAFKLISGRTNIRRWIDQVMKKSGGPGVPEEAEYVARRFLFEDADRRYDQGVGASDTGKVEDFNEVVDVDEARVETFVSQELVLIAMQTSDDLTERFSLPFSVIDQVVLTIFIFEIAIKWFYGFFSFWLGAWNIIDFVVIFILLFGNNFTYLASSRLLRLLRVLRAFRSVRSFSTSLESLSLVVDTILHSIPDMANVSLLLLVFMTVAAVIGVTVFGDDFQEHFGSLMDALFVCFICVTEDGWVDIFTPMRDSKNANIAFASSIYFLFLVMIGAFVFSNLIVAVVVTNLEIAMKGLHRGEESSGGGDADDDDPADDCTVKVVSVDGILSENPELVSGQRPVQVPPPLRPHPARVARLATVLVSLQENVAEYAAIRADLARATAVVAELDEMLQRQLVPEDQRDPAERLRRASQMMPRASLPVLPAHSSINALPGDILSHMEAMQLMRASEASARSGAMNMMRKISSVILGRDRSGRRSQNATESRAKPLHRMNQY